VARPLFPFGVAERSAREPSRAGHRGQGHEGLGNAKTRGGRPGLQSRAAFRLKKNGQTSRGNPSWGGTVSDIFRRWRGTGNGSIKMGAGGVSVPPTIFLGKKGGGGGGRDTLHKPGVTTRPPQVCLSLAGRLLRDRSRGPTGSRKTQHEDDFEGARGDRNGSGRGAGAWGAWDAGRFSGKKKGKKNGPHGGTGGPRRKSGAGASI